MSLLTQKFAHHPHLGGGFVEDREQLAHSMCSLLTIMTTSAFKKSFSE